MKHSLIAALGLLCVSVITTATAAPNILLILADDLGWGDLRTHGNDRVDTPVLDRLAKDSVELDRFFVSPLCSPTRASLLTGRHHLRLNVLSPTRRLEVMLGEEVTLAEAFKSAGYATGCFGKWHNGFNHPSTARGQGFDEFFGFNGGFFSNYFDAELEQNGKRVATKGFITDVLTDAALKFIERNKSVPFFCYVPFNAVHSPMQASDTLFEKYTARGFEPMEAAVHAMAENMDANVGRLLAKLDELKLAPNTIVMFASDNGPNSKRFNGGMRGAKGSVFEGGMRVPCFLRWPGKLPAGGVVKEITQHVDIFPTLLDLAGLPLPKAKPLDGSSLVPLLRGEVKAWPVRKLFDLAGQHGDDGEPMKQFPGSIRTPRHRWANDGHEEMLFNLQADPGERTNLVAALPALAKELRESYLAWFNSATSGKFQRFPIIVGNTAQGDVQLNAQSGTFHGSVKLFGKGWDYDWATGFKSADDAISWDLDVTRAARWEVSLLYTCPQKNLGAKIRVEVGMSSIERVIDAAHDPAPTARPDRVPRWEVPDKKFSVFPLGALELKPGRTRLTVRAVTTPAGDAMELQGVRLHPLP